MSVLESDEAKDEQKAVYLCWLIHLVGDIHQSMHTTAKRRIVEAGYRLGGMLDPLIE